MNDDLQLHRRRVTRHRVLGAILALLSLAALPAVGLATASPAAADPASDVLTLLNSFRAQNGVGPVRLCRTLTNSIQAHTDDMAVHNYVSHTGLDGSTFVTRDEAAGYTGWSALGENIAAGFSTASAAMTAWINSPDHRANMLDPAYTDLGVGMTFNGSGVGYWGQEFGAGGTCDNGPVGNLDQLISTGPGVAHLSGWALELGSLTTSIPVDVYADGQGLGRFTANTARPDIATVFSGAGLSHGFSIDVPVSGGLHTICAYGIAVVPGDGNLPVGCAVVAVANPNPIGSFDTVSSPGAGQARVTGWTFDPETANSIYVHVYADNQFVGQFLASTTRADVGAAFPYGSNHGFDATFTIGGGMHNVCAYGINVFHGGNTVLGCKLIGVPSPNPIGSLDSATRAGNGLVAVSGWSLDPETAASIQVHVYVDSTGTALTAGSSRPDIAVAFPGYGPSHGYSAVLAASAGTHLVCAYGMNVGLGTNTLLGCRNVVV